MEGRLGMKRLIVAMIAVLFWLYPAQALSQGELLGPSAAEATLENLEMTGGALFWSRIGVLEEKLESLEPSSSDALKQQAGLEKSLTTLSQRARRPDISLEELRPALSRLESLTERLYRSVDRDRVPLGAPLHQPV